MKISLHDAHQLLMSSEVVAIPTETVWGLAARFNDDVAVKKIFSLKQRSLRNPLIIHAAHIDQIVDLIDEPLPRGCKTLMSSFWPGPLTLVLPCQVSKIPSLVRSGLKTAAFRIPLHQGTQRLLDLTGPLVAPSANKSGKPSSTAILHVERDFGSNFPCYYTAEEEQEQHGIESTVIIWNQSCNDNGLWYIGRLGSLSISEIETQLQEPLQTKYISLPQEQKSFDLPLCPGQMYRHYAPDAKLTLGQEMLPPSDALENYYDSVIGFSDRIYCGAKKVLSLGTSDDVRQILQNLYRILRQLDEDGAKNAWVDCRISSDIQTKEPLWHVFFDRLYKAAAS